jgi:uncharacterized iron-regulated protein
MNPNRAMLLVLALAALLGACRGPSSLSERRAVQGKTGGDWMAIETVSGRSVSLDEMAMALARCDVVFLGEEHDKDVAHELQMELTRRIVALRPNASLSFEMIERDAQVQLDRYLAGSIDEKTFLADTRPWPNYAKHYRPMVEFARAQHLPVLAANVPRPLASRVSKEGLEPVADETYMPRTVLAPPGEYAARFAVAMGNDEDTVDPKLERWFTAQCVKDEAMAESIERGLCAAPGGRIVIHYCGKFHSDYGLGTVERLRRRQPSLRIGLVSTLSGERDPQRVDAQLARAADYVWLVAR